MSTTRMQAASDDGPPPDPTETVVVNLVCNLVHVLTSNLRDLETRTAPALDGYVSELAEELAGVTFDWVRRGPRR